MKENNRGYVVLISLIVALGGFLMGFDASVISGVVKFIEPEFDLTKIELGWAVSSLTLTATLAMMIAGPLSDKFGRKATTFLCRCTLCHFCHCFGIGAHIYFSCHCPDDRWFWCGCFTNHCPDVHCRNRSS